MEAESEVPPGPQIRLAIIGAGFGRRVLLPAFRGDARFSVVALCTRDEAAAARAAAEDGVPEAFGDWKTLLDTIPLDAIAISVPPDQQPEIAVAALRRGIAVFCEKPLSNTLAGAEAIAAAQYKTPAMVDFEFPEIPTWRRALALVASEAIGTFREIAVSWNVQPRSTQTPAPAWKTDSTLGGGALQAFASHTFHYIECFGGPIARLEASLFRRGDGSADTVAALVLELASGAVATARLTTNGVCRNEHRVELLGTRGRLTLLNETRDYVRGFQLLRSSLPDCASTVETESFPGEDDGRIHAARGVIQRFGDWIQNGTPQRPSIADGVRVQQLIESALASDQRRRPIEVPRVAL